MLRMLALLCWTALIKVNVSSTHSESRMEKGIIKEGAFKIVYVNVCDDWKQRGARG